MENSFGTSPWSTDISSVYLTAYTTEKLFIRAGPEFGDQEGHLLVVSKALYGLRSSDQRFNEHLGSCLESPGFEHSKCEPDIWIRDAGDYYEYVASYVDDLAVIVKDPQLFFEQLKSPPYNFELKGSTAIDGAVHLGCAFARDQHGVLYMDPNQYIKQMEESY